MFFYSNKNWSKADECRMIPSVAFFLNHPVLKYYLEINQHMIDRNLVLVHPADCTADDGCKLFHQSSSLPPGLHSFQVQQPFKHQVQSDHHRMLRGGFLRPFSSSFRWKTGYNGDITLLTTFLVVTL